MRSVTRIKQGTKAGYWAVVRDCLVDFYRIPAAKADALTKDRRAEVEFAPNAVRGNIFYHHEPLDVAAKLASRTGPVSCLSPSDPAFASIYEGILRRHGLA